MSQQEELLGTVARGIIDRRQDEEIWDAWIADTRPGGYGTKNSSDFEAQMRFISGARSNDPDRTNLLTPGMIPADGTFRIKSVGIQVAFSDRSLEREFFRTAVISVIVGDRPALILPASLMATPATMQRRMVSDDIHHSGLRWWYDLERSIAIPPRQGFEIYLETADCFARRMRRVAGGQEPGCYAMVKLIMKGDRTFPVFEDDLDPEQLEEMRRKAEERVAKLNEELAARHALNPTADEAMQQALASSVEKELGIPISKEQADAIKGHFVENFFSAFPLPVNIDDSIFKEYSAEDIYHGIKKEE